MAWSTKSPRHVSHRCSHALLMLFSALTLNASPLLSQPWHENTLTVSFSISIISNHSVPEPTRTAIGLRQLVGELEFWRLDGGEDELRDAVADPYDEWLVAVVD